VLEVGDIVIRESTAICEWLEDVQPEPSLWPRDATMRAQARGLLRWVDDELTLNFFLSMRKQAFGLAADDHPEIIGTMRDRLVRRWPMVEAMLERADGPWFLGGEDPTLVDLAVIPLAVRLPEWKPELAPAPEAFPRTVAWLENLRARPSAAEVDRRGEPISDS
jgi:glutathione S-transferase